VLAELTRPTFQKIGLNEFCKFISIESLLELLKKVKGLEGHVQTSILNTLAVEVEEIF
jgi:hypothetical protein